MTTDNQNSPVAPQGVVAWMTPEGDRVVTAETMDGARKDGGASLSSLRPYTIALVRAEAPALEAPAAPAGEGSLPSGFDVRRTLQFIHDTFKKDLDAGYRTKDKEFAVSMAAPALAAAPQAPAAPVAAAISDAAYCALQYVEHALAAIANREELADGAFQPMDSIGKASKRAKAALTRLQSVAHHFSAVAAPAAPAVDARDPALPSWWPDFIQCVAELPDRNSPEDEPDAMIATAEELGSCALAAQAKEGGEA